MNSAFAKTVFLDGVYTLSGRAIRTVLALLLSVLLARWLGPHDRGLYALPSTVYTGVTLSVFTGIIPAVSYFMLNHNAGRAILRPALLTGLLLVFLGSIAVSAMAYFGNNAWAIGPSVLLLVANVPVMIILGYAVGTKRIRWQSTYLAASTAALLFCTALVFLLLSHTAIAAVSVYVFVNLLIGAACLVIMLKDSRSLSSSRVAFGTFLIFCVRSGLSSLVTQLNYRGDLYVVALLTTPSILGEYTVAVSAAETLLIITQIPALVTSPHVGAMERAEAARLTATCVRGTLLTALVVSIAFAVVLPYAVHILYGQAYMPIVPALRLLLVGVVVLSLATPIANFFTLKLGRPEITLLSAGCASCVCLVTAWLLVPRAGMVGAAFASALAYVIGQGIAIALFLRSTDIRIERLFMPTWSDLRACARLGRAIAGRL